MYMKRLEDFRNIYDTKYLKYEIVKFKCYTREIPIMSMWFLSIKSLH